LSPLDSRSQVPAKLVIILPSGKHIFFRLNNSAVPSQHVVLRECESPARWGGANMEIFPKLPRASKGSPSKWAFLRLVRRRDRQD